MTTVSINQPAYLPWLGYFDRIAKADVHIVLDHVQFEKNSYVNRNKIRLKEGSCWLTVPVKTRGRFGSLAINKLEIAYLHNWQQKHLRSLQTNYGRAPYFARHKSFFEDIYAKRPHCLIEQIQEITEYLLKAFSINTKLLFSSRLDVQGTKSGLILNICQRLGATTYLSGPLGREYLDAPSFENANIELIYQDYRHPIYTQTYPGFEPYMAAIDLLFNHGNDSLRILRGD
jgi:hypothetical protein